jgi:site-specific recombinase XerD
LGPVAYPIRVEVDISGLLPSWKIDMQARRMSPSTIDSYVRGVTYYLEWCEETGVAAPLSRTALAGRVDDLLARGAEPATARIRQQAVRRFAAWLASEDEIDADPFLGVKPPKLDVKVVQRLSDDELRLMLKACAGKALRDRRDEACLRLLAETGMRAGELLGLNVPDVDLGLGVAVIRRGKGGAGSYVPFGPVTGAVVDRYLRVRRHHRLAGTPALWLAETGGVSGSDITGCGWRSWRARRWRASRASTCTSCGTLSRRAGWRPRAVRAG